MAGMSHHSPLDYTSNVYITDSTLEPQDLMNSNARVTLLL